MEYHVAIVHRTRFVGLETWCKTATTSATAPVSTLETKYARTVDRAPCSTSTPMGSPNRSVNTRQTLIVRNAK